ncbi:MAG: hypothetical protein LQ352_003188 [Teloschistes flavicans]|nr:MAG: hypothetical protein LQ352_003188 [Teloschistes flavicans]
MHLHFFPALPFFLSCMTSANPVQPRGVLDYSGSSTTSTTTSALENQPGPYTFAPAPVWRRDPVSDPAKDDEPQESKPGPYTFEPAPIWRRDAGPNVAPEPRSNGDSLENTPGPYKFKPAPVWPTKPKINPKSNR